MAHQGAGLGLTISKAYVDMLEGKLWLESEINTGSTFYFTLPYKNDTVEEIVSSEVVIDKPKQLENLKILIVEDDEFSNELLLLTVGKIAKEIISVKNGNDAINPCKNHPNIDLILMDIQMPNMNGYEATKANKRI